MSYIKSQFSNSNGITFGTATNLSGNIITASHNGITNQSVQPVAVSGSNGSFSFATGTFGNLNGMSFYTSNGSMVGSYTVPSTAGLISAIKFSAGTQSSNVTAVTFSNANGITFGLDAGTITASHNGLTTAMASNAGSNFVGLNTAQSNVTWTVNSSGISFDARGYAGTGTTFAGTNVSASATLNSNGLNLALSAGAGGAGGVAMKGSGTYTQNTGTVEFANSNGITFGLSNNGTMTASHNGITQQSTQPVAVSGSNGSFNFSTLTFGNLNGASFYTSNGSMVASYTVPTQTVQTQNLMTVNGTQGNVTISGGNGVTVGNNASTITISVNTNYQSQGAYLTTARASNDAIGLNTALTANGVSMTANSSGLSLNFPAFLTTAMASNRGSDFVQANAGFNGTNASGTIASNAISVSVAAQTNQSMGLYALGNTTGQSSSSTFDARTLSFNGAGNVSVGYSAGSVVISGGTAAASPVNFSAGTTSNNLGSVVFSNANGVSFGLNGSTITASAAGGGGGVAIAASNSTFTSGTVQFNGSGAMTVGTGAQAVNISVPATSSLSGTGQVSISVNGSTISIGVPNPVTRSGYAPYADRPMVVGQQGNGSLQFDPDFMPNVQFDRVVFPMAMSNATNSSGSQTLSFWAGIYTRNASTLSLLYSASGSTAVTQSGTAGSYSLMSGMRNFTIPMTQTVTEGQYWLAFLSRTTSGGANASYSNFGVSQINSNFVGYFGSSHNTTMQITIGRGVYTATTNAMPASVAFSQIRGSDSIGQRPANLMFASSTI